MLEFPVTNVSSTLLVKLY